MSKPRCSNCGKEFSVRLSSTRRARKRKSRTQARISGHDMCSKCWTSLVASTNGGDSNTYSNKR